MGISSRDAEVVKWACGLVDQHVLRHESLLCQQRRMSILSSAPNRLTGGCWLWRTSKDAIRACLPFHLHGRQGVNQATEQILVQFQYDPPSTTDETYKICVELVLFAKNSHKYIDQRDKASSAMVFSAEQYT